MSRVLTLEQRAIKAEYAKEWRKRNPAKAAMHAKKSRLKHLDKVAAQHKRWAEKNQVRLKEKSQKWYQENKELIRDRSMKRQFGIGIAEYRQMLDAQNGACYLCGGGPNARDKALAVDHCHTSGKVRKLLCRGCNVGIGNLKDSVELLLKAAKYIQDYKD